MQYLLESLDNKLLINHLLFRYKQRSECFRKLELIDLLKKTKTKKNDLEKMARTNKEKVLSNDLYLYLHDQGMDFEIEVQSGSRGRIDFKSKLGIYIGEAKVFKDDKAYIISGIRQLTGYLAENNVTEGVLPIFNVGTKKLLIEKITLNGYKITPRVIDLRDETPTVLKNRENVEISQSDFLEK